MIMQEMARPWFEEVESPSAIPKDFSNTPQPKPDLGQGPVAGYGMPLDCLGLNLALEAGLMKSQNSSAKRTPNISSTTFDNSSVHEEEVLLIFTRKIYPEINPGPERHLIERLRRAIFTDTEAIEPRTIALLSLANSTNILPTVFDRKDLIRRKKRVERIITGEIVGGAAEDAISVARAALMHPLA